MSGVETDNLSVSQILGYPGQSLWYTARPKIENGACVLEQ